MTDSSMLRRACAAGACAAIFLLASPREAGAYVEVPMSLGDVIRQSTHIVQMQVTKVDREKNLIIFTKLQDIKGKKGYPLGPEMMQNATEGTIKEVTYWWPRPGSDKPLEKTTFYTKVGDQICGAAYYVE